MIQDVLGIEKIRSRRANQMNEVVEQLRSSNPHLLLFFPIAKSVLSSARASDDLISLGHANNIYGF